MSAVKTKKKKVRVGDSEVTTITRQGKKFSQKKFDKTIGRLDRILSKLMGFARDPDLDVPNRQTLKHHVEDMEACAKAIREKQGLASVDATPQP